jgi:hypothetical protein
MGFVEICSSYSESLPGDFEGISGAAPRLKKGDFEICFGDERPIFGA